MTERNAHLLARWLPEWIPDADGEHPVAAVIVEGDAVAICACARIPDRAVHAGVETARAFRGNGYAALATRAWAVAMRKLGVFPLYGTSWANLSSRRVATKLGLVRYGTSICLD